MSNPPDADERFADDQLAALRPASDWTPDPAAHLDTMHVKRAAHVRARNQRTAVAIAVALVFLVVPVTRAFGARCVDACVNAAQRVALLWNPAEPLANAPKSVGATIGDLAPDVIGHDAAGLPVSIAALQGRVVIVNFWATWCAPCRQEIPLLNDLQNRFGGRGLKVVGVSLDEDGWPAIDRFVTTLPVQYRLALGDDNVASTYGGIDALPATVVIDANSVIVARMTGALHDGQYDDLIEQLLR